MKKQDRTLRIIGGKWRGRKITFADSTGIRPTADRVRETLFNWLREDINGAKCLELFAGSGTLSMEALSRGAAHVTLIDSDASIVSNLNENFSKLGADPTTYRILNVDTLNWLAESGDSYDVVFVDPPFAGDLLDQTLSLLASRTVTSQWIYLESDHEVDSDELPESWSLHRKKQAGAVHYTLCESS